jgi:hypothetical protein
MNVSKMCRAGRWCWLGWSAVMLSACAHDPAPKARCHGPWVWVTPAAGHSADARVGKGRGSDPAATPIPEYAPAQPVPPAGPR